MRRFTTIGTFLLGLCPLSLGCAPQLARPDQRDLARARTRWPETTLDELRQGRALYVQRCSGCHTLPRIEAEPPRRWGAVIAAMVERRKVRLGLDQRRMITRYLTTMATRARPDRKAAESRP